MAVVSSAETSDTGMHQKNGRISKYKSVIPGPEVVTISSKPKGPPVV
jgi:hypothetical protein